MKFLELLCQLIIQPDFDFDILWLYLLKNKINKTLHIHYISWTSYTSMWE